MTKIKTIIIGLGDIGMGFSDLYKFERNHSSAVIKNQKFQLLYGIDSNKKKRIFFQKKFKIKALQNIKEIPNKDEINFAIISSNTESHMKNIKKIINFKNLRYILCEKPLCKNLEESELIEKILKKKNIRLFVNYHRRCLPLIENIKKFIKDKKIKVVKVFYPSTLLNNGSHFLDMILFLFRLRTYKIFKRKDFFQINSNNIKFFIYEKNSQLFDSKLIFQKKNKQLIWEKNYIYYNFQKNKKIKKLKFNDKFNQKYVLNSLLNEIKNNKTSLATMYDAINVHRLIKNLIMKSKYE